MRATTSPWVCATEPVLVPRRSTPLLWSGKKAVGAPMLCRTQPTPYRPINAQILVPDIRQIGVEAIPSTDISRSRASSRPARRRRRRQRQPAPPPSKPPRRPHPQLSPRLNPRLQYVSSPFLLAQPPTSTMPSASPFLARFDIFSGVYIMKLPTLGQTFRCPGCGDHQD